MWDWLSGLSGGAANFVGSLTGSLVGLLAILVGAMLNAHLNRKRDDRLRKEETRAIATALRTELAGLVRALEQPRMGVFTFQDGKRTGHFWVSDLMPRIKLLPELLPKLGTLNADTIELVIDAHLAIEEHFAHLRLASQESGKQSDARDIQLPNYETKMVDKTDKKLLEKLREAIRSLDGYLS
jgi:hypothetical protein